MSNSKTDQEWAALLSEKEFYVCRQKGTERPFSGEYWDFWEEGEYLCRCCGEILFQSNAKFDAGCGWPSFDSPHNQKAVRESLDTSHGMHRTEVTCSNCGSHLGHLFTDGPTRTGLRYCINSVSIQHNSKSSSET